MYTSLAQSLHPDLSGLVVRWAVRAALNADDDRTKSNFFKWLSESSQSARAASAVTVIVEMLEKRGSYKHAHRIGIQDTSMLNKKISIRMHPGLWLPIPTDWNVDVVGRNYLDDSVTLGNVWMGAAQNTPEP